MPFEIEEIRKSQEIFAALLENHQVSEEKDAELFDAYTTSDPVQRLTKSQGDALDSDVEQYGDTIYLIPREDNYFLGYSKAQLKAELCRSNATDKDYYLSQFVILTLLSMFYDGVGVSAHTRDFIRAGELQNTISERLSEARSRYDEDSQQETGIAFTNISEAYEQLKSDEKGSRARTTKEGFLYYILRFLERQGLIEYIETDDMIKTTKKLDQFMDWNLLNKNNYQRVLRVLGELDQDGDMVSDDEEERDK
ncbi:MAG: DUF6063 family protein [Lachnospiraceae bacterium]|nr:DUF6063 family protein [Lachnospiraceae bacterium]